MPTEIKEALDDLYKLLICNNCSKLPEQVIWLAGGCTHKYCEVCVELLKKTHKTCLTCIRENKEVGEKHNEAFKPRKDILTTRMLAELKQLEAYLKFQNLINDNPKSMPVEKSVAPDPEIETSAVAIPLNCPNVYDLKDDEVFQMEEEQVKNKITPFIRNKKISNNHTPKMKPLELDMEDIQDFPPILTQHGNTPKAKLGSGRRDVALPQVTPPIPILSPKVAQDSEIRSKGETGKNKKLNFGESKSEKIKPQTETEETLRESKGLKRRKGDDCQEKRILSRKEVISGNPNKKLEDCQENLVLSRKPIVSEDRKEKGEGEHISTLTRSKRLNASRSRSSSVSSTKSGGTVSSVATSITSRSAFLDSPTSSATKRNAKGETPLHIACRNGQIEKVKQLLEMEGVDINAKDFAGWTALHEAINSKNANNYSIIEILCEAGCRVNIPGLDNETPLHESVRGGKIRIIKYLLSQRASTKLRNRYNQLPRDVTTNETIVKILDDYKGPYVREANPEDFLEEFQCTNIYFADEVDGSAIQLYKKEFKAPVAEQFNKEVTHVIFNSRTIREMKVQFSLTYLLSVLNGCWLLSSKWLESSVKEKKFEDLKNFEILGCLLNDSQTLMDGKRYAPSLSRTNKESGNPGLFQGLNFYIYKTCSCGELTKKDLINLIKTGDGIVLNREPNPDAVDPMDNLTRFHAKDPNHKMVLTSHVILYNAENEPDKKYAMEHVKTLRVDWLIDSILNFNFMDPDNYL